MIFKVSLTFLLSLFINNSCEETQTRRSAKRTTIKKHHGKQTEEEKLQFKQTNKDIFKLKKIPHFCKREHNKIEIKKHN
jgi:hypothetical protein